MLTKYTRLVLILIVLLAATSQANIFISTESQSFKPDTVYDDDIFIGGNYIRFQSQVTGDLIGGSQEMVFSGTCDGNINWCARWITINGPVKQSVRGFAQTIDINASIGRNLIAMGQTITIGPATSIVYDASLYGAEVVFEGSTGRDLIIGAENVTIAGTIGGNLEVEARQLEIKPTTIIEGDLFYKSPEKIKIEDSVIIRGETHWTETKEEAKKEKYNAFAPIKFMIIMYLVLNVCFSLIVFLVTLIPGNIAMIPLIFLALIVSGIVIVSLNRKMALKAINVIENRFLVSLGLGVLLTLLFPIAALLAILTVIGIPLGLIIIFAFGIFGFAGAIYSAQFVGSYIGRLLNIGKQSPSVLCLIIGIIVLAGLTLIPYIGWIVVILTMTVGLGAAVLSLDRFKGKSIDLKPPETSKASSDPG